MFSSGMPLLNKKNKANKVGTPSAIDDPESFHQLELDEAFRNGTIVENDGLSKVTPGSTKINIGKPSILKPEYKEKYQGLLTEFSWLDSYPKVVGAVKNQGKDCASSYAFATIAALESAQALTNVAQAKSLSE
jgi:hypothetical protein